MKHSKKPAFKPASAYQIGSLAFCQAIIAEQQRLLDMVKSVLPAEIAAHALHCVASGKRLLIYTASASWASQIRFFQQVILNKLRESGQRNISGLQVKVLPQSAKSKSTRYPVRPAPQTVSAVFAPFDSAGNDELTQALSRLGKTLMRKQ